MGGGRAAGEANGAGAGVRGQRLPRPGAAAEHHVQHTRRHTYGDRTHRLSRLRIRGLPFKIRTKIHEFYQLFKIHKIRIINLWVGRTTSSSAVHTT